MIRQLRERCIGEILDYNLLASCLSRYKAPNRKITALLQAGDIIRVKKGLYIFGEQHRRQPIHLGLLANIIFGPSYVSKEYALSFYGMIPERVEWITSMTSKRKKKFHTPLGVFSYDYLNPKRYTAGVDWQVTADEHHYFIASPEKALADLVFYYKEISNQNDMRLHLIENLRIDVDSLQSLNIKRMRKIALAYQSPVITLLLNTLQRGL